MKKILVPLDFSEHSKLVYRFALEMAKKMQASLTLYHAFYVPFNDRGRNLEYGKILENLTIANRREIEHIIKENTPQHFSAIHAHIALDVAIPEEGILKAATDLPADLVLMGMRNKNKWDDFLFGSISKVILKNIDRPILVIPPEFETKPFDNLLYFAHLGSPDLKKLRLVDEWAKELGTALHCVFAANQYVEQKEMEKDQEKLRAICAKEYEAKFSIIPPEQDVKEGIATYIAQHGISLLAMENHDKTLQKLLHTGNETGIVRHLHLPVLFLN